MLSIALALTFVNVKGDIPLPTPGPGQTCILRQNCRRDQPGDPTIAES